MKSCASVPAASGVGGLSDSKADMFTLFVCFYFCPSEMFPKEMLCNEKCSVQTVLARRCCVFQKDDFMRNVSAGRTGWREFACVNDPFRLGRL